MTDRLRANLVEFADEVEPVDLRDRVLAGARRNRARRVSIASVVVVGIAALAATEVLVGPAPDRPGLSYEAMELIPGHIAVYLPPSPEPEPGELANAAFTVPPFADTECPHGEVTTSNGVVEYPGHPFLRTIAVLWAGRSDVDDDGREDVVARITCTHRGVPGATQVVAYARTPSGLRLMGTVAQTASPIEGIFHNGATTSGTAGGSGRPLARPPSVPSPPRSICTSGSRWPGPRGVTSTSPSRSTTRVPSSAAGRDWRSASPGTWA
jgi:hypothetical protein